MRKFFYILGLLSILGLSGFAQQFKKLKVGLGTGYAFAGGRLSKVLFAIEPSFLISDKLSIGLRAESTIIQRDVNGNTSGANISYINFGSYSLNGQRYFGNMSFRPFIGFGVGYFKLETVTAIVNGRITKEDFKFGFYPRIGFDFRHFNFLVDYNLVPNPSSSIINETLNKYLSVRLGFFIGGGRRDK
jgi:hypothetical protein